MTWLIALHFALAALAPALFRQWGRNAFWALALVPAASFAWVLAHASRAAEGDLGTAGPKGVIEVTSWLPSLHLDLALRFDPLGAVMAGMVTGVGALALVYCSRYFGPEAPGLGRLGGVLLAFAGAMLGLVLADDLLLLYVFWELTTVFSYLLVGHSSHRRSSRRAATQALIVTTFGGLAMLVGLIMLGEAGDYRLSRLLADPPSGTAVNVALVLVLLGALSKSAIFPFHFWLPAAMAAPTPVSAYLHAAAMVKAGIYLVARLSPGFAEAGVWHPLIYGLGLTTMVLGGWRALRQTDLKLLLAFGTVSQLGFLLVLTGAGTRAAALAGITVLVAHAVFKATLFLVVGIVDATTGTRDVRELSGLGRTMPLVAVVATIGAASMAGVPPLLGFVGKEAALAAFTGSPVILVVLVVGSILTVAYSARFVHGAFATKPGLDPTTAGRVPLPMLAGPVVLAALTVAGGLGAKWLDVPLNAYAHTLEGETEHLALWHGFTPALGLSVLVLAVGAVLHRRRATVEHAMGAVYGPGDADETYRRVMRGVDRVATTVTAATQRGSLTVLLVTILGVLVVLPGGVLLTQGAWPEHTRLWDSPLQLVVGAGIVLAAVGATVARQRLAAVVMVGVTGYGVGLLFVLNGAPDLALTQFLVETLSLVVFVLVLRKLPKQIVQRTSTRRRWARLVIAVPVGLFMAGMGAVALGSRTAEPIWKLFPDGAYSFGYGHNVVNVTLVDIRAWDTFGEISVIVVAATGVASMIFLRQRTGTTPAVDDAPPAPANGTATWLRGGSLVDPRRRSLLLEVIVRLIFHTVVLFSLYLLFAGHNVPGGGFAGGLVAGLALVTRYLAGGRYELGEAAKVDAGLVLGLGLLLAAGTAVAGLVVGGDALQTAVFEVDLPVWGHVKVVSALIFDIGVYLVVLGLVLDILRSLGAEIDRRAELS